MNDTELNIHRTTAYRRVEEALAEVNAILFLLDLENSEEKRIGERITKARSCLLKTQDFLDLTVL